MFIRTVFLAFFSLFLTATTLAESSNKIPVTVATHKININTADEATLSKAFKSLTPRRAKAIINYRTQHGPFKKIEDLSKVKGLMKYAQKNQAELQKTFTVETKP